MNSYDLLDTIYRLKKLDIASLLVYRATEYLQSKENRDLYDRARRLYADIQERSRPLNQTIHLEVQKYAPGHVAYGEWSGNPPEDVLDPILERLREEYKADHPGEVSE